MTTRLRNIFYWMFFSWIIFFGIFCIGLGIYTIVSDSFLVVGAQVIINQSGAGYILADVLRVVCVGGISLILSIIAAILFFRFFKPIADSQTLFFFVFFFSLSFEMIKTLSFLTKIFILPESFDLFLSQAALFGYLIGLFSMFLMSLYQIKYRHQGIAMMLVMIVSITVAALVPMNTSELPHFIYSPIYRSEVLGMVRGIIIVTVLGYLIYNGRENLIRMFSVFLMLTGHSLVHFALNPVILISGGIMLLFGVIMYVIQLFRAYFWY